MVVLFSPQMRHVDDPALLRQESRFCAAVATGPAAIVGELKSAAE